MSDTKLMPCPMCAAPSRIALTGTLEQYFAICQRGKCMTQGPVCDTEKAAAAAWNTRPAPALTPKQAAADEMFDALKLLLSFINRTADLYWKPSYAKAIEKADAALAKAGRP